MELTQHENGQVTDESRDTLFLMGGAAMIIFGAGLILSTPPARRLLGEINVGKLIGAVVPDDLQRYLKIRAM
jgi:hypothetical protein